MVEEKFLKALNEAINDAAVEAASRAPTSDKPPVYQWGFVQGKYAGLKAALSILKSVLDETMKRDRDL